MAPRSDFPNNHGGFCYKGWTATELLTHSQRLTTRRGTMLARARVTSTIRQDTLFVPFQ